MIIYAIARPLAAVAVSGSQQRIGTEVGRSGGRSAKESEGVDMYIVLYDDMLVYYCILCYTYVCHRASVGMQMATVRRSDSCHDEPICAGLPSRSRRRTCRPSRRRCGHCRQAHRLLRAEGATRPHGPCMRFTDLADHEHTSSHKQTPASTLNKTSQASI